MSRHKILLIPQEMVIPLILPPSMAATVGWPLTPIIPSVWWPPPLPVTAGRNFGKSTDNGKLPGAIISTLPKTAERVGFLPFNIIGWMGDKPRLLHKWMRTECPGWWGTPSIGLAP